MDLVVRSTNGVPASNTSTKRDAAAEVNRSSTSTRHVRLLTCTWNAGNAAPPRHLEPWIPSLGGDYDMIVVGLQECTFSDKKKAAAQARAEDVTPEGNDDERELDAVLINDDTLKQFEGKLRAGRAKHADSGSGTQRADVVSSAGHAQPAAGRGSAPSTSSAGVSKPGNFGAFIGAGLTLAAHSEARHKASHKGSDEDDRPEPVVTGDGVVVRSIKKPTWIPGLQQVVNPLTAAAGSSAETLRIIQAHIGDGFTLITQMLMYQLGIMVFVRKDSGIVVDKDVFVGFEATGLMGIGPNKGGVAVQLNVSRAGCAKKSLCFVSSHLAAHMQHGKARDLNVQEIIKNIRFDHHIHPHLDFDCKFDHVFWMGDLNYRIDLALNPSLGLCTSSKDPSHPDAKDLGIDNHDRFDLVQGYIANGDWRTLVTGDQLNFSKNWTGMAFVGFEEGPLAFNPTFKVQRTEGFAYKNQRVSSWCDRVLWKSLPALAGDVQLVDGSYTGHPSIATSDHKPVSAAFELALRPAGVADLSQQQQHGSRVNPVQKQSPAASRAGTSSVPHSTSVPHWPHKYDHALGSRSSFSSFSALPGAIVTITGLQGKQLCPMDDDISSDPYCVFMSDQSQLQIANMDLHRRPPISVFKKMSLVLSPKRLYIATTDSFGTATRPETNVIYDSLNPVWHDNQVPRFKISAMHPSHLETAHLFILVMDRDPGGGADRMGQVVLPLRDFVGTEQQSKAFEQKVAKNGRYWGTLSGKISIQFPPQANPGTRPLSTSQRSASSNHDSSCCSVQ